MRLLSLVIILVSTSNLFAHRLLLITKLEEKHVRVEAFFEDDSPGDDATVQILDESGKVIVEGKTDSTGVYTFPNPPAGKYRVKVSCVGHVGEAQLEAGPTREELTRTPWFRVGLGLGVITALTLIWRSQRKSPGRNELAG